MSPSSDLAEEAADLLSTLIANRCVNSGPGQAEESRNVDSLVAVLEGPGIDIERYAAEPGRDNLVARIEGTDPTAPTMLIHSHLDVAPADPRRWQRDPFGGERVEGEVWGRGALSRLNQAATAAVALRRMADAGFKPAGTLVFVGAADHEAGGRLGVEWLHRHHAEAVAADFVLVGTGGHASPGTRGLVLSAAVGEKGHHRFTGRVRPAADRSPYTRRDGVHARAAKAVDGLVQWKGPTGDNAIATEFWDTIGLDSVTLGDKSLANMASEVPGDLGMALAAAVHLEIDVVDCQTVSGPGDVTEVELDLLVTTLADQDVDDARRAVDEASAGLLQDVELVESHEPGRSKWPSPLWDALGRAADRAYPGAVVAPVVSPRLSGAGPYRRAGAEALGFAMWSLKLTAAEWFQRDRGDNERIDEESLGLTAQLWMDLANDLLAG
ncbi:MAG TPA: M20/M25/M40 family metallo-hydrolase [Microthrixaceae bacterium]|nr:M20/M25/M40 family metallo-hydrolase [Microthrixaceae bacterium]HMT26607.1 M20/M25/M40 family metallo-hydrolase [Microthrixaceae bacterium]HMT62890.1 M20/M25/M40 family metallo-hydrolase [Microthrixaceae bacterium]